MILACHSDLSRMANFLTVGRVEAILIAAQRACSEDCSKVATLLSVLAKEELDLLLDSGLHAHGPH